jgi:hypothetical protein
VISILLYFLPVFYRVVADTLLGIIAPLNAPEIEFWVGNPRVAFFAASSDVVFEEFCGSVTNRAFDFKNVFFFPVVRILSRAFHLVCILSLSLSNCNGTLD